MRRKTVRALADQANLAKAAELVVAVADDIHEVGDINGNRDVSTAVYDQLQKMGIRAARRERVADYCAAKGLAGDTELLRVFASVDANELKHIEIENKVMGIYDKSNDKDPGKPRKIISFDGARVTITQNVQINEAPADEPLQILEGK